MNIELVRDYCLNKQAVTESFPFHDNTLVFKVVNKIFLFSPLGQNPNIMLKARPEEADELKEKYNNIVAAYHLNKHHWIQIFFDDIISDKLIYYLIDSSYDLVKDKLPRSQQIIHKLI